MENRKATGWNVSSHDMSRMSDMLGMSAGDNENEYPSATHAMHSMAGQHEHGPHMKMTAIAPDEIRR